MAVRERVRRLERARDQEFRVGLPVLLDNGGNRVRFDQEDRTAAMAFLGHDEVVERRAREAFDAFTKRSYVALGQTFRPTVILSPMLVEDDA